MQNKSKNNLEQLEHHNSQISLYIVGVCIPNAMEIDRIQ